VRNNPLLMVGVLMALSIHLAAMYLPWLQRILSVRPPTSHEWWVLPLAAVTLLVVMESQKISWRWRQSRRQRA